MLTSLQLTIANNDTAQTYCPEHVHEESFQDVYQIIEKIGEGAHSVVYKVLLKKTGKVFAAK